MNPFLQRNRCRSKAGFTLLELMTALAITSMLVVMLFAALNQASRAWNTADKRVETFQTGRAILDLMARDLAQTYVGVHPNVSFTAAISAPLTTNSFSATIGTNGAVSDICDVTYEFNSTAHTLTRLSCPWTSSSSSCSFTDLADTGTVLNCSFTYYTNAFSTGTTTYDSAAYGGQPPAAVQISLDLLDAKSAAAFAAGGTGITNANLRNFSTIVYIPSGVR
ncbi:MAG: prepilin-type N-terminal cleavage/methylation domain-containing protein [Verrucomicrobiia bacterium]